MGLLFNRGSDSEQSEEADCANSVEVDQGCTAHHFGEYEGMGELRTKQRSLNQVEGELLVGARMVRGSEVTTFFEVERKFEKQCQHESCYETASKWERVGVVEDLDSLGDSLLSTDELREQYKEDDDDE